MHTDKKEKREVLMKKRIMTEGAPWKHILSFAFPVLLGSLLQQLYSTFDTIIVGKYASEDALSAVGTTNSFAFFFLAIAMGFSAGNGVIVAQYHGAGDEKMVRQNASTGIIMLLGMGLVAALAGILVAHPAYEHLVKVPESILDLTVQYFRIYSIGLLFQFGYNIFSSILRAVGDSAATLYFLLISSVINIGLDMLFVAGFKWGVSGAAAATDIAQLISFVAAYIYMTRKYPVFRFKISEYTWNKYFALKTLKVGFPIAIQLVIVSLGLTFIQRAVNGFGKVMTASFTVGQRIEMYLNLPCNAFQTTLATYTGQNIGAGKMDRVKTGVRQTIIISLILTVCISLCVWLGAEQIGGWFGLSEQAQLYCIDHLRTIALINIVLSSYIPLFGVFQGANHSVVPTCVAMCAITIRVIVTYLFRNSDFLGYTIVWWNGIFGFGAGFTITWSYYLSRKWQKNSAVTK